MTSVVKHLVKRGLIKPPGFVDGNIQYETEVGSVAYGTSVDDSDLDLYGFCIPPQHILFPHLVGIIPGFDRNVQKFDQYQKHHILDPQAHPRHLAGWLRVPVVGRREQRLHGPRLCRAVHLRGTRPGHGGRRGQ